MRSVFVCSVLFCSGAARAASVTNCSSTTGPASYYASSCASTCAVTGAGTQMIACGATYIAEAEEDWNSIGDYKYTVFGTLTSGGSKFCCYVDSRWPMTAMT